ncbi:MAG: hypothetical protein ACI83O_000344 [Patescibacteria group bacterium]|jgi:hypothetical protein
MENVKEDKVSKEDNRKIKLAEEDIRKGRLFTHEQVKQELGL